MYKLREGDCLDVLRNCRSEFVDLIYLDPPYGSQKDYGDFSDKWEWDDVLFATMSRRCHGLGLENLLYLLGKGGDLMYLAYMTVRLWELYRVLKSTGSIYLHCDWHMSHYLKIVMDKIFGKKNFRNEIVWRYSWGLRTDKCWNRKHDSILMYSNSENIIFNANNVLEDREISKSTENRLKYKGALITDGNKGRGQHKMALPSDVWYVATINGMAKERIGYPTQKPEALLERIIKASSNEGDLVLDPFCGSGTTLAVCEKLNRKSLGIDISPKALSVAGSRLAGI